VRVPAFWSKSFLSMVTSWEMLRTESLGKPVALALSRRLPGASANFKVGRQDSADDGLYFAQVKSIGLQYR
jgi:hypothetical protein